MKIFILLLLSALPAAVFSQHAEEINIGYLHTASSEDSPARHDAGISLRSSLKGVAIVSTLNYAGTRTEEGIQYTIDAFPKLSGSALLYLNAGYSSSEIFPNYRAGIELFKELPGDIEVSAGTRLLKYESSEEIFFGTVSAEAEFSRYSLSARPFFNLSEGSLTSVETELEYAFSENTVLAFGIELGDSPDEINFENPAEEEVESVLDDYDFELGLDMKVSRHFSIQPSIGLERELSDEDEFENKFSFTAGISYDF
jgi:YaiO family outer membrane protein